MAIFGRSKKKRTAAPLPEPTITFYQQPNHSRRCADASQPSWAYLEERPQALNSNGSPHGWLIAPVPPQYQPVLIHRDYLPLPPRKPRKSGGDVSQLKLASVTKLLATDVPGCGNQTRQNDASPSYMQGAQHLNPGAALCDLISSKLDNIITLIDGERFSGDELELGVFAPPRTSWEQEHQDTGYTDSAPGRGKSREMVNNSVSAVLTSTNYFAKVYLYANSRLPPNLLPLKLYMPTFPLLCLAAQYSERVYAKPTGQEKEVHLDADWRLGTKAMVIKSVPMDDMNTIVFAIRGTQTFMDWAVNLKSAPASPEGFLDDPGNFCHAGFLTAAKKMIKPVAARLRHLLQEDPSRFKCSLLITGHSAGGAVAALLYSHMLAKSLEAESELNILAGCFKRIHCVSFGAPPVSLLPISTPEDPALRKSIFLSFVNEGDPVPRADKAYVRSLLDLYSSPAPGKSHVTTPQRLQPLALRLAKSSSSLTLNKMRLSHKKSTHLETADATAYWPVPEATLSNAGRLVLLRGVPRHENRTNKKKSVLEMMNEGVAAQVVTDELLRGVVWGDPVCHMMKLYARRIELLATNAVTGRSQ
ncbi:hypothetical protein B2J93_8285 [Marssonina coronariae]|uniref:Fungal lipase-type domain-containing protein n=1 Tax=Diplocarpon coronariae TaxID=2795749 RepID=A0A218YTG4_9HELO|nr:hypothetical protein JHW43_001321 [Diplocarpon mali]OWO98060.1 hypothetical protein B2J93_8285 [Marssonina coronariae]